MNCEPEIQIAVRNLLEKKETAPLWEVFQAVALLWLEQDLSEDESRYLCMVSGDDPDIIISRGVNFDQLTRPN